MPYDLWLSRLSEEFGCLPSAAIREWQRAPDGLLERIIEARHYARAKDLVDEADRSGRTADLPDTPLMRRVQEIELTVAAETLARRAKESTE